MDKNNHFNKIQKITEIIRNSKNMIVLTGAGVSTGSGIPDFRTPGKGLWEKVNPYEVTSIDAFYANPKRFYHFYRPRIEKLNEVASNPSHNAIAKLEEKGYMKWLITQNIDNLHRKAGSKKMIKIHGTLDEAICSKCHSIIPSSELLKMLDSVCGGIPYCECGGIYKPNVTLFGEMLTNLDEAITISSKADLMLIVGSSLQVSPANLLPQYCVKNGGKLIIANQMPTHLDNFAEINIRDDVCVVLPEIVKLIDRLDECEVV